MTQNNFASYPLLWLACAWGAGSAWAHWANITWHGPACAAILCTGAAAWCVYEQKPERVATILLLIAFVLGGATLAALEMRHEANAVRLRQAFLAGVLVNGALTEFSGIIEDAPERAPDGWYWRVRVESVRRNGLDYPLAGHVSLFAPVRNRTQDAAYQALNLHYGQRLQLIAQLEGEGGFRNPGNAPRSEYLDAQDLDALGTIKGPEAVKVTGEARRCPLLSRLYATRQALAEAFRRTFDTDTTGVLNAALLGWRHSLPQGVAERFREGGTFHVLVISGFHITFLAWLAQWLLRRVTSRRRVQLVGAAGIVWLYALMIGLEVSVTRAALMFSVAALAAPMQRTAEPLNTLGGAALLWLAWRPRDVFDASFQLTFVAVFAILALAVPLWGKLASVGRWRPEHSQPVPPDVPRFWRTLAEVLFWSECGWQLAQNKATYRYQLFKTPWAARFERWHLQKPLRWLLAALWVSLCVSLVMLPLTVLHFHRVAWAALVLNLVVGVLMGAVSFLALLALAVMQFSAALGAKLVTLTQTVNYWLVHSVDIFTAHGLHSWRVPEYDGWRHLIYALYFVPVIVLAAWAGRWRPVPRVPSSVPQGWRRMGLSALIALGLLAVVLIWHPYSARHDGRLHVTFLDVGQGDCALLTLPDGTTILVDAGGRLPIGAQKAGVGVQTQSFQRDTRTIGEAIVSEYLWYQGLSKVDYLIASHAHADHINGLNDVARNFSVRGAFVGRTPPDNGEFTRWAATLRERNIPLHVIGRGTVLQFGAVTIETLWPQPTDNLAAPSENNDSLVLRVRYGARAFLLTGDAEAEAENEMLQQPELLRADVVKAGHHGSRTSSTPAFVAATQAQYVVASVGLASPFGHPHAEVVARWRAAGAQFWTTGARGLTDFSTDGADLVMNDE